MFFWFQVKDPKWGIGRGGNFSPPCIIMLNKKHNYFLTIFGIINCEKVHILTWAGATGV